MSAHRSSHAIDTTSSQDRGFAVYLMEHLVVPAFVIDTQCKVLIWNKACERLTGVAARDVVGTSWTMASLLPAQRPCLADLLAQGLLRRDQRTLLALGPVRLERLRRFRRELVPPSDDRPQRLPGDRCRPDLRRLREPDRRGRDGAGHHGPEGGAERLGGLGGLRRTDGPRKSTDLRRGLDERGPTRGAHRHSFVASHAGHRPFQIVQRQLWPPARRRLPETRRGRDRRCGETVGGCRGPLWRRGVCRHPPQHGTQRPQKSSPNASDAPSRTSASRIGPLHRAPSSR